MTTPEGNFETMVSVIRSIDPQNLDPSFRGIEFQSIEGVFDERAQVEVHCNESLGTHLKRLAKRDKNFDALIKELIDQQRPDSSGNIRFNRIFSSVLRKAGKFVIKLKFLPCPPFTYLLSELQRLEQSSLLTWNWKIFCNYSQNFLKRPAKNK